jgi:hypothetical protein
MAAAKVPRADYAAYPGSGAAGMGYRRKNAAPAACFPLWGLTPRADGDPAAARPSGRFPLRGLTLRAGGPPAASPASPSSGGSPSRIRDQYRSPHRCPVRPLSLLYLMAKVCFSHFIIAGS